MELHGRNWRRIWRQRFLTCLSNHFQTRAEGWKLPSVSAVGMHGRGGRRVVTRSLMAPLVEQSAISRSIAGSSPAQGPKSSFRFGRAPRLGGGGRRISVNFAPIAFPKERPHGRPIKLAVVRHCSNVPLVERARLDQSKQPCTAIETEFVEGVPRGHGIKAPLPFKHDLDSGQRTVFFD
jgi:hypothetical protein